MKKLNVFTVFLTLVFFCSCSGDDSDPKDPKDPVDPTQAGITFGEITAKDYENMGHSGDILLSYTIPDGDISKIEELRFFVSTSSGITVNSLLQVSESNYRLTPISASVSTKLDANLNDIDGNLIVEGADYTVYILAVLNDDSQEPTLSNPISLRLNNEIVVTTPKLTGSFNASEDIVITSDGTLYANEGFEGSGLYKVTPEGASSVVSSAMQGPVGIALDNDENVYTSNFGGTVIKKITPSGVVSDFVTDSRLAGGGGLAFDNDGNLFNTFYSSSTVYRVSPAGDVENFATSNVFNGPVGVAYDRARGNLFVASFDTGKIFNVSDDGSVTEVADTDLSIGHLSYANDHFYITGWNEHKVYKVSLTGEVVAEIGSGSNAQNDGTVLEAAFTQPNGIEATTDGRYVYVTQGGNGGLRKIVMPREN